jgi:hypothetical protein
MLTSYPKLRNAHKHKLHLERINQNLIAQTSTRINCDTQLISLDVLMSRGENRLRMQEI